MKEFKIFVDFNKEEQYLNEMARKGYIFKKQSFLGNYYFLKDEKQELKYRIDYRTFKNKKEFENYKTMFEDFGWNHISGKRSSGNQYFLPKNKDSSEEIFSTEESANFRYKELYKICTISMSLAVIGITLILSSYEFKLSNMMFLTPGLWERSGSALTKGVLFELPFVIFRIAPIIYFFIISLIYGILGYKTKKLSKEKTLGGN